MQHSFPTRRSSDLMRTRAVTGRADITDVLAGGHLVTGRYVNAGLPHVPVRRRDRLAGDGVLDDDEAAVTTAELRDGDGAVGGGQDRSEEHTSELQSRGHLV